MIWFPDALNFTLYDPAGHHLRILGWEFTDLPRVRDYEKQSKGKDVSTVLRF